MKRAKKTVVASQMANSIAEKKAKQKSDHARREAAAPVQHQAATAASAAAEVLKNLQTDTSMQHDGIVDDEPIIVPMGTKRARLERSPRRGDMMPPTHDESGLSLPRKNQHVAASNTAITFG